MEIEIMWYKHFCKTITYESKSTKLLIDFCKVYLQA